MDVSRCSADDKVDGDWNANVESWIQGLNDSSYRKRRDSFLKLCDRSIPLDAWLEKETKSGDRYRSTVATWLKRMRRSTGSIVERSEMLRDYEALRNMDESVLERCMADGQWERLLELVALLEPNIRIELLRRHNQLQGIIDQAWKSNNESFVPKLLDLVLQPNERVSANRLWRSIRMPEEWKVSQNSDLTSVKIFEFEADGDVDAAVSLAKKASMRNLIEPMLIRSNGWEEWLKLDRRRTPIISDANIDQQQVGILLLLGRLDEANEKMDKILASPDASQFENGNAVLLLALGRMEEFDACIEFQSGDALFNALRAQGHVQKAFKAIGLNDLSVGAVEAWLKAHGDSKQKVKRDLDPLKKFSELALADYADLFFQIGFNQQGELIDSYIVERIQERELGEGSVSWNTLIDHWLISNERAKAVYYWKSYIVRNPVSRSKPKLSSEQGEGPFETLYSDFPQSAQLIFEHLLSLAENQFNKTVETKDIDRKKMAVELAIDQMELLHVGRLPANWSGRQSLSDMRKAVVLKSPDGQGISTSLMIELAKLFDSLGETLLAIETLEMCSGDSRVNHPKSQYLIRIGQLDAACDLLIEESLSNASDIELLIDCTEALERVGRFSELDRHRIRALSSVVNDWTSQSLRTILTLPENKLIQFLIEQRWRRDRFNDGIDINAVRLLRRQFDDMAKNDLSQAKEAADYSRIEALVWIKLLWPQPDKDIGLLLSIFGDVFQSLILEAVEAQDRDLADKLIHIAFRCKPQDIDMPIVVVPFAERIFGKQQADEWFDLYYQPMLKHLEEFPDDSLIGNNTAWLAASCNRHLEKAQSLASHVTASHVDATYLDTLAEVEYRLGNVARAVELSELCLKLDPKDKQHRAQLKRFRAGKP